VCLGLVGLLLVFVSLPPGYRLAFGQTEVYAWDAVLLANGLLYLVAAALIGVFRTRLGIGLGLVLAMAGFTLTLAIAFSSVTYGFGSVFWRQLLPFGGLAFLHALAFAGALAAAQRRGIMPQASRHAALIAAILAGLGLAVGLAYWGGGLGILMSPTNTTDWFRMIQGWLPLFHFVAVAAIALRGRLALPFAALVSVGGTLVALAMLVSLAIFRGGALHVLDSVALWGFFLVGYAISAGAALRAHARAT